MEQINAADRNVTVRPEVKFVNSKGLCVMHIISRALAITSVNLIGFSFSGYQVSHSDNWTAESDKGIVFRFRLEKDGVVKSTGVRVDDEAFNSMMRDGTLVAADVVLRGCLESVDMEVPESAKEILNSGDEGDG